MDFKTMEVLLRLVYLVVLVMRSMLKPEARHGYDECAMTGQSRESLEDPQRMMTENATEPGKCQRISKGQTDHEA
jgi:hypothetical protein